MKLNVLKNAPYEKPSLEVFTFNKKRLLATLSLDGVFSDTAFDGEGDKSDGWGTEWSVN